MHYNGTSATATKVSEQVRHISPAFLNNWNNFLEIVYIAETNGRVEIFVANESDKDVWFDDIQITHEENLIVQENHYYPFGMNLVGIEKQGQPEHKFQYNGKEKQMEFGLGLIDYGNRMYDPVVPHWLGIDKLAAEYANVSPYVYVLNNPINAIDPDGKRVYFVAGAGGDKDGWNYTDRFESHFYTNGISWGYHGFKRLEVSGGQLNDMLFSDSYRDDRWRSVSKRDITPYRGTGYTTTSFEKITHPMIDKSVNDITSDLANNRLSENEQLNLAGYSYGSVLLAHTALDLADKGIKVDHLILIGSPISDKSRLYKELKDYEKAGKIGKVIRFDIEGDYLSNPQDVGDYLYGIWQNSGAPKGNHFDLARPDDSNTHNKDEGENTNRLIQVLMEYLRSQGVSFKNDK